MKTYLIILLLLITFSACNNSSHYKGEALKVSAVSFPPPVAKPDNEVVEKEAIGDASADVVIDEPVGNADVKQVVEQKSSTDISKKIIKEGDISFETTDVKATRQQIISSLKKLNGYIESDQENDDGGYGRKEYTLDIKIPANNFDTFLSSVSVTATKIDSKNISIRDVTTEYIDTKTRLDNKKILEGRYLELLKRASKISEMLEIENKLANIRADIESSQGQLNYLNKQVAYSSLTIKFYTERPSQVETSVGFGYKIWSALGSGLDTLQGFFFTVLSLWPFWLIVAGLYVLIKKWRRRVRVARAA
nr:DUF4349 domain-containing protein [uncultured Mucilaginibacter sp.]